MELSTTIIKFSLIVTPLILAITLHEVAHGWAALRCGDATAKLAGRLSLNPFRHIDPIGTVLVPTLLFALGGLIFGWAKPVPVNWYQLRRPKRDMAIVAIAGPGANLLMSLIWALLWKISLLLPLILPSAYWVSGLNYMSQFGVIINIVLMIFNLLPIPPLDGSRVIGSVLSTRACITMHRYERYGFVLLLALMMSGILYQFIQPLIHICYAFIRGLFHV